MDEYALLGWELTRLQETVSARAGWRLEIGLYHVKVLDAHECVVAHYDCGRDIVTARALRSVDMWLMKGVNSGRY